MKKILRTVTGVAALTVLLFSMVFSAQAAPNGIYTAPALAHYVHPSTGEIEDSGKNERVGQPMTESVLGKDALIEVDSNGNTYATVRFSLMDNIKDIAFSVQKDGNSPFQSVSYTVPKENLQNNTSDFRFQVPSETAIIRASFYVKPMGRAIVFFIDFNTKEMESGSGDFVPSIKAEKPKNEVPTQEQQPAQSADTQPEGKGNVVNKQVQTKEQETESSTQETDIAIQTQPESSVEQLLEGEEGLRVYKNAPAEQINDTQNTQKTGPKTLVVAVIVVAVVALLSCAGWYISKSRRKR